MDHLIEEVHKKWATEIEPADITLVYAGSLLILRLCIQLLLPYRVKGEGMTHDLLFCL